MVCKTCLGFGLHALGEHTPMGPMDAADGMPTIKCPECGANKNPARPYKIAFDNVIPPPRKKNISLPEEENK
jgi:hypothetical protein